MHICIYIYIYIYISIFSLVPLPVLTSFTPLTLSVRRKDEIDRLRWYCQSCRTMLVERSFYCFDLGSQLVLVPCLLHKLVRPHFSLSQSFFSPSIKASSPPRFLFF